MPPRPSSAATYRSLRFPAFTNTRCLPSALRLRSDSDSPAQLVIRRGDLAVVRAVGVLLLERRGGLVEEVRIEEVDPEEDSLSLRGGAEPLDRAIDDP